ncbi:MAG: glycosyltransferase family 87 protein [Chloroflexota bacterium]|nr:glycosyltransferase family 87 protein [Anaerolineales bacterium]
MDIFKRATKNKFVLFLTLLGVLIFLLSLLPGLLGLDRNGIGQRQLLVAIVGAAFVIVGIGLVLSEQETGQPVVRSSWLAGIPSLPNVVWVLIGSSIAYVIFLVAPMFFDAAHQIEYFGKYLYALHTLGTDFLTTLNSSRTWFAEGIAKAYYPPLTPILFAPFGLLAYPTNYHAITIISVISYFVAAGLLPCLLVREGDRSGALFIFGISIFSYGFQFELERGQFHTIAMLFCMLAIYLFHRQPRQRFFAYVLFCISVQLKIYPALFVVMFVDDWRDWKTNLKRFAALGMANFALLFLLGFSYFSNFTSHLMASSADRHEIWAGNHSIKSFLTMLTIPESHLLDANALAWLQERIGLFTFLFLAYFAICFVLVWVNSYRRNLRGIDSLLLMACTLGVLTVPPINHDYTLPLLATPFALMVAEPFTRNVPARIAVILLLVAAAFAYAATLVPYIRKPLYLQNSFPLLIVLLTATTLLSFLREKQAAAPAA